MPKHPSKQQLSDYYAARRFCGAMMFLLNGLSRNKGERPIFPEEIPDTFKDGTESFSAAMNGINSLCRDLLEMTQDYDAADASVWDYALNAGNAPTMSEMRVRHWGLIPEILNRARIKDDSEYYLLKGCFDRLDISEEERLRMAKLLDEYELKLAEKQ